MDGNLARVKAAVARFEGSVSGATGFNEDLAREYDRLKRALAASFQSMSLEAVPRTTFRLDELKRAVAVEMRRLFEGRVDSSLFVVRGYTTPHPDLYALLADRVGEDVPGWRLRLLSGDKIHTERRTRELRDLGLNIEVSDAQDDAQYRLVSLEPNLAYAAAFQLRENATKFRRLSPNLRADIVHLAEVTVELPQRKTAK